MFRFQYLLTDRAAVLLCVLVPMWTILHCAITVDLVPVQLQFGLCFVNRITKSATPDILHHSPEQDLAQLIQGFTLRLSSHFQHFRWCLILSLTPEFVLHQCICSREPSTTEFATKRLLTCMCHCMSLQMIFSCKLLPTFRAKEYFIRFSFRLLWSVTFITNF